ncbi:MAG: 4-alpha-glucanotransferase [Bacteroidales bacterium]|nr:4-alpha-glucanotransferase [Bacteroidales bacterium]
MKVTFNLQYNTRWGESLTLVSRDIKHPMKWNDGGIWSVTLPSCTAADLKDYTYIVIEDGLVRRTEWTHHHRKASECGATVVDSWIDCPIPGCPFPREHQAAMFDRPGYRGAGTAVPVFSLRTADDFGIGEFRDLRPLVDWAAETGQSVIQLLPVNDTTRKGDWQDSYPYSPVSSFALNPLYIRLQEAGVEPTAKFRKMQKDLNSLPAIDYPKVFKAKMSCLRKAYLAKGEKDMSRAAFKRFFKENSYWLEDYASFCAKRDGMVKEYYFWIQYHLDRQFREEAEYARSRGVSFKGDLPIGISADSADAFWHPELFNLDSTAGAPPDFFSADGQNWGFPTYNWEEMAKDDYAWWKSRLRHMSRYFDAYRIDHILGFFRIWEIPSECRSGLHGHFNPAIPYSKEEIAGMGLPLGGLFHEDPRNPGMYQPLITADRNNLMPWQRERFDALYNDFFYHRNDALWERNARLKLPELLGATGMLACGEDLGMVPDCVPGVMHDEKILSFEMSDMDKGRPWPCLSVCATSNHDLPTLRVRKADRSGSPRADPRTDEVARTLRDHLDSGSMLAIFPLQDWLALDPHLRRKDFMSERVNQPADPDHHWCFRFHLETDVLLSDSASDLNASIAGLLTRSRRGK